MATDWKAVDEIKSSCLVQTLANVCEKLKEHGVDLVTTRYSGGGDSGDYEPAISYANKEEVSIPSVEVKKLRPVIKWDTETKGWVGVEVEEKTGVLLDVVETLMAEAVEIRHSGWYDNDGGQGEVTLDVEKKEINVHHGDHFIATHWDDYSFAVGGGEE